MREAGYATALVGKWHLGAPPNYGPLKSGYELFYGMMHGAADYFDHTGQNAIYENERTVEAYGYKTNLFGDRAIRFIRETSGKKPFFLSLHFNAPHWPWEGPDDAEAARRVKNLRHYDGGSLKTYMEMVQSMDLNVGRVLDELDACGIADNTIVVFTSDNGGERFSDMWPFSGEKGELLEGGLRIPTFLRWPRAVRAGQISTQVMMSMDWMPTLLAAAGLKPDCPFDGLDLMPHLAAGEPPFPRKLYWRYRAARQRAVRDGDWKYLSIAGHEFLFDLANDQRERANLREHHKDIFERLKADYVTWNESMLPERQRPTFHVTTGNNRADRYGFRPGERADE